MIPLVFGTVGRFPPPNMIWEGNYMTMVKVKRDERAKKYPLLSIKKPGDVGYDLTCTEDMLVLPGERKTISTGICLEMPDNIWATIEGRSSASRWEYDKLLKAYGSYAYAEQDCLQQLSLFEDVGNNEANVPKFLVVTGIIDTGYRGELKAVLVNIGPAPVSVEQGERYAQVIFHEVCTPDILEVDKLASSERGATGFGSSGK